jgi:hypothetical protein
MVNNAVIWFVVCTDPFLTSEESFFVFMEVGSDTGAASIVRSSFIIFAATACCPVCCYSCWLVDTPATILMFVAVLSTFTGTRIPFKPKLVFGDFHYFVISAVKLLGTTIV